GVLIKGGAALEALGAVRAVALDKTGTLTRNQPRVIDTLTTPGIAAEQVLAAAAALEVRSDHPLAAAILTAAPADPTPAEDVQAIAGHGLTGTLAGTTVRLGKPGYIDPGPLAADVTRLQEDGATVVLVEEDGRLIGGVA